MHQPPFPLLYRSNAPRLPSDHPTTTTTNCMNTRTWGNTQTPIICTNHLMAAAYKSQRPVISPYPHWTNGDSMWLHWEDIIAGTSTFFFCMNNCFHVLWQEMAFFLLPTPCIYMFIGRFISSSWRRGLYTWEPITRHITLSSLKWAGRTASRPRLGSQGRWHQHHTGMYAQTLENLSTYVHPT